MGTLERTETLTHRLGSSGQLSIKAVSGLLRVRGIQGDDAHLTVRYRIRATDQAAAERALDTGHVSIDRSEGRLTIETPERRLSTGLAWLFGGARVSADISVDVPWGTKVRLETMGGSIEAVGLTGDQRYRTISGDVRMWSLAGPVDAGAVSGSIALDRGGELWLRANTVSGSIRTRADRYRSLALSTTSGGIYIVGALDPAGGHHAYSISGSVELTAMSGVSAELRTISGSIQSDFGSRVEGGRGAWRAVVGDGRARFRVNSTSGGLRLMALPAEPASGANGATKASPGWSNAANPDGEVASTGSAVEPAPEATCEAAPEATSEAAREAATEEAGGWSPEAESGEALAEEAHEDEELAVLQALERGEIGVDEASTRLERMGR